MCPIVKKELWKVVPIAVKNALASGNILFGPGGGSFVAVVLFVLADSVDEAVFVESKRVKPANVVKEKDKQRYRDDPWSSGFCGDEPGLFFCRLWRVEIRL